MQIKSKKWKKIIVSKICIPSIIKFFKKFVIQTDFKIIKASTISSIETLNKILNLFIDFPSKYRYFQMTLKINQKSKIKNSVYDN